MDFSLLLLAFAMFWKLSYSIRCYKCLPEPSSQSSTPSCEHFDGSDKYITDCPYSTVCVKKETSLINLEQSDSVERDCAKQMMGDEQVKVNGRWEYRNTIHEVYTEKCEEDSNESGRPTKTTHCFCRGNLCNHAVGSRSNFVTALLVIGIWTAQYCIAL